MASPLKTGARWAVPLVVAVGFAAVLLFRGGGPAPEASPMLVELPALIAKGAELPVPAGRPLLLQLDLSGLPLLPAYNVEVTDAAGVQAQGEAVAPRDSKASITVPTLPAGPYYVHVRTPSGELLREYGFRVLHHR